MPENLVRTAETEPEAVVGSNYEDHYRRQAAFVERQATAPMVIHAKDRPLEQSRQGLLKFFLKYYPDQLLQDWMIAILNINKASGRHIHQGGVLIFIIEGCGYSTINGIRHDWKAGDLVVLPLTPGGIEHQHFNLNPNGPSRWMAFISMWVHDHTGSLVKQVEVSVDTIGSSRAH